MRKKIDLQEKVHRRICVRDIIFFNCAPSFLCHFLLPFPSPFPSDVLTVMEPIKIHNMCGIQCDGIMSERLKI